MVVLWGMRTMVKAINLKLIANVGKSASHRSGGFYCWAICVTFSFQGAFVYSPAAETAGRNKE